jgi:predicted DNA-binding transcriptional regulator YafY
MIRSTRAQKAERLRAARRLLADETGMAEAAMALSRAFGLSRRQAYRYLKLARAGGPTSPAESSVTITLKMPESLARGVRDHASKRGVTTSDIIRRAVFAFLTAKRRRHG